MKTQDEIPPTVIVIFGGAGDLAWRKLVPALFNLYLERGLPKPFAIVGMDRAESNDDDFRERLRDGVDKFSRRGSPDESDWQSFAENIFYRQADFLDQQTYSWLADRLHQWDQDWDAEAHWVFYCATPPAMFGEIPPRLDEAGLAEPRERSRVVIEKPIGHDLQSARDLNQKLTAHFHECQIFRIDHYLGKETVQNLLAFRFANGLFEPIWNRRYVDHVTITVTEEVGVEHRGDYYDHAGALRDMVQNHLLQLLCMIAMEPPVSFASEEIRNKKDRCTACRASDHSPRRVQPCRSGAVRGRMDERPRRAILPRRGRSGTELQY